MTSIIISCSCGLVTLLSFLITCNKKRSVTGLFNKTVVSLLFIFTAVLGVLAQKNNPENVSFAMCIVLGECFGLLGDIFLDQKWIYEQDMAKYLNAGFVTFGIGHLLFTGSIFIHYNLFQLKNIIFPIVFALVVFVGNTVISKLTKLVFGKFTTILNIYCIIISFMVGTAIWAAFLIRDTATILFAIGGIFFLLSDLVLSPMYFKEGKNTPINFVINHVTYYIGQYLIAISISFLAA